MELNRAGMNEYTQEWKRYRRLVIYWVVIFAACVPVLIIFAVLSRKFLHTDALTPYVAGFWACLWIASILRICAFGCPRCEKCFIGTWWFANVFGYRKCAHCGLPRDPEALSVFPSWR